MVCFPFAYHAYHASPPSPKQTPTSAYHAYHSQFYLQFALFCGMRSNRIPRIAHTPPPQKPQHPHTTHIPQSILFTICLIFWYTSHLQNTHTTHTKINFIYNLPYFVVYAYFFQVCNFIFESLITIVYQICSLMYIFVITSKVLWDKVLIKIFPKLLLIYIFRKYKISLSSPPPSTKKNPLIKVFHSLPL